MVCAHVPNFVSFGLFCRFLAVKRQHFAAVGVSAFWGVATWQQFEEFECGQHRQTFPYPMA